MFQGSFKCVSRKFPGCFKEVFMQRYIFLNYSGRGGGIKSKYLGKNEQGNWYIRTFFHILTQKWVNFKFGKL